MISPSCKLVLGLALLATAASASKDYEVGAHVEVRNMYGRTDGVWCPATVTGQDPRNRVGYIGVLEDPDHEGIHMWKRMWYHDIQGVLLADVQPLPIERDPQYHNSQMQRLHKMVNGACSKLFGKFGKISKKVSTQEPFKKGDAVIICDPKNAEMFGAMGTLREWWPLDRHNGQWLVGAHDEGADIIKYTSVLVNPAYLTRLTLSDIRLLTEQELSDLRDTGYKLPPKLEAFWQREGVLAAPVADESRTFSGRMQRLHEKVDAAVSRLFGKFRKN